MKRTKKVVSTLVTIAMVGTLVLPAATPAFAASENRVSKVVNVSDDFEGKLGTLTIKEDDDYKDDFTSGETFTLSLPANVEWAEDIADYVKGPVSAKRINDQTLELTFTSVAHGVVDKVDVDLAVKVDGAEGDIKVEIDGRDSGVSEGSYLIARVAGGDTITTVLDVETVGDGIVEGGTIKIEEAAVKAMGSKKQKIVLKLPKDFDWNSDIESNPSKYISFSGGFAGLSADAKIDGRNLIITIEPSDSREQRGVIYIKPSFKADDASYGDVEINVSGDEVDDADVVVAKYADFGLELSVDDVENVVAGKFAEETGTLTIKEAVPGTLINGRDVTVELPSWVKITKVDVKKKKGDGGINLIPEKIDGEDNKVDLTVKNGTNNTAAEFEVDFEVSVQANKTGDIEAKVTGKAGGEGEIVIAKAIAPVTVESVAKAQLKIGVKGQPLSDIIITETADENIREETTTGKKRSINC